MTDRRRRPWVMASLLLSSSAVLTGSAAALAQVAARTLIALTLSTGIVAICEVRHETDTYIKVYNLRSGEDETYPKDRNYRNLRSNAPPPRSEERPKTEEKRSEIKAVGYEPVTRLNEVQFKRLGAFPDNVAAYLSWAVKGTAKGNDPVVAVLPLQSPNQGRETDETAHRSEELTNALVSRKMNLVERSRLGQAVGELLAQNQVLFDPEQAQKIGKLTGASAVVVGTLTPMGRLAEVNIRLVDVETARILEAITLKDVEGLPGKRAPINRPVARRGASLVGTWDMTFARGARGSWTFRSNNMWDTSRGAQGSWTQTGDQFTIRAVRAMTPAKKKGAAKKKGQVVEWQGRILPDGMTIEAENDAEGRATGRRR